MLSSFIFFIENKAFFYSGDSSYIPTHEDFPDLLEGFQFETVFLNIRDHYMYSHEDVVKFADQWHPSTIIPLHWIEEELPGIQQLESQMPKGTKLHIIPPI